MVSTVVDIIRTHADLDSPALVFEDREISYRTLHARSSQVAQAMRAAGVNAGDRVAFLDKNRPEYFDIALRRRQARRRLRRGELAPRTARGRPRARRRRGRGAVRRRRPRRAASSRSRATLAGTRVVALDGTRPLAGFDDVDRATQPADDPGRRATRRRASPSSSTRRAPPVCPRARCSPTATSSPWPAPPGRRGASAPG